MTDICSALSVEVKDPNVFVSKHLPERMGNSAPIAYGGFALATALSCSYRTVDETRFRCYSAQGSFLGPASIDRALHCHVRHVRSTKSFATRLAEVGQVQDDGKFRVCLIMLADFHAQETRSMFDYSVPQPDYTPVQDCAGLAERGARLVEAGKISQDLLDATKKAFGVGQKYFDQRGCPEGVATERLYGAAKHLPSSQDHLSLTDRRSADWLRARAPCKSPIDHAVSLAFIMDGALAFLPLTHSGQFLDDAAACSSLDFSLRFFDGEIDANEWHLRELRTIRGGQARTFTESRLFRGGKLVLSMTQQGIMRPKPSL